MSEPKAPLAACPSREELRRTYRSWESMRARCLNPKHPHFKDYAGRGIGICQEWESFERFVADAGLRPSADHFLDRIDNGGSYEPGNVRWATRTEQHRNKRSNHLLTFGGETLPIVVWAERLGIGKTTIRRRLALGWSVEDALTVSPAYRNTWDRMPEADREAHVHKMHEARYGTS